MAGPGAAAAGGPEAPRTSKLERELADPWKEAGRDRVVIYTPDVLRSALHNAILAGSVADAKLCVSRGASLEWRDPGERACGMTALQLAACSAAPLEQRLAVAEYLLGEKVDVAAIDYVESTALHIAAALGDAPMALLLLRAGASPRSADAEGLTPLHLAANNGHLAAAVALTDNYAPLDATDCEEEDIDSDPKFADDVASRERNRRQGGRRVAPQGASLYVARRGTPLHVAAAANRLAVAQHLLQAGAPVNSAEGPQRSTPLHIAARGGLLEMANVLLAAGADREARDERDETPLMRAVEGRSVAVASMLLARGCSAATVNRNGLSALHLAAACGLAEFFAPLVAAGADPNGRETATYEDFDGARTPMHYAAHYGDLAAFQQLQKLGGDPRALSAVGWPPLFYAVEASKRPGGLKKDEAIPHLQLVKYILEEDRKENLYCTVDKQRTPLMVAAMQDAAECAVVLCEAHPWAVNLADARGRTAMHWGAVRAATAAMEAILEHGGKPSVDMRDADGKTPGELLAPWTMQPVMRKWEEERRGAMGEKRWDYGEVMESTALRYLRKAMAARRVREIARERRCGGCGRYTFDARRCGACKEAFYCSSDCQARDWTKGGHRLQCGKKK